MLCDYGIGFGDFPEKCTPEAIDNRLIRIDTNEMPANGNVIHCQNVTNEQRKYSCRNKFGANFIYITYPKILVHMDDNLETMYIQRTNDSIGRFYSLRIKQPWQKSPQQLNDCHQQRNIDCRIYNTKWRQPINISLLQYHNVQRDNHHIIIIEDDIDINNNNDDTIELFCFVTRLSTTTTPRVWPLNCITYCRACKHQQQDRVWFRIDSLYSAIAVLLTIVMVILSLSMILGYLLVRGKPNFWLVGNERVVILQNRNGRRRESVTIFIMPSNYVHPTETNWLVLPLRQLILFFLLLLWVIEVFIVVLVRCLWYYLLCVYI